MIFKTISSSSKGNCFLIDELIIDIGLSYKQTKPHLNGVKYILLTHIHGDHFNPSTVRKIVANHEDINFICCDYMERELLKIGVTEDRIKTVVIGSYIRIDDYIIAPIRAYHDVDNCGYRIARNGLKHLHITDTVTLEGIEAINYDSASIECNHDESKALELIQEAKENGEFSHLTGAMNSHLSVQQTIEFCKENNIKHLIPVHVGASTKDEVIQSLRDM